MLRWGREALRDTGPSDCEGDYVRSCSSATDKRGEERGIIFRTAAGDLV